MFQMHIETNVGYLKGNIYMHLFCCCAYKETAPSHIDSILEYHPTFFLLRCIHSKGLHKHLLYQYCELKLPLPLSKKCEGGHQNHQNHMDSTLLV